MLGILGRYEDRVLVLEETHTSKEPASLWPCQLAESDSGDSTRPDWFAAAGTAVGTMIKRSSLCKCSKLVCKPLFL